MIDDISFLSFFIQYICCKKFVFFGGKIIFLISTQMNELKKIMTQVLSEVTKEELTHMARVIVKENSKNKKAKTEENIKPVVVVKDQEILGGLVGQYHSDSDKEDKEKSGKNSEN